jgi:hypothetical protein
LTKLDGVTTIHVMSRPKKITEPVLVVDGRQVICEVVDGAPKWTKLPVGLVAVEAILCRRGKVHAKQVDDRVVCGKKTGPGWVLAPGAWTAQDVVRCRRCEVALLRRMEVKR